MYSCEVDPRKSAFLRDRFPSLPALFTCVIDMAQSRDGRAEVTGGLRYSIPCPKVLVGGFPCTDISSKNIHSADAREACESGTLRTGSVFSAIIKLIQAHGIELIVLEHDRHSTPSLNSMKRRPCQAINADVCQRRLAEEEGGLKAYVFANLAARVTDRV